jgi:hypothetical protein
MSWRKENDHYPSGINQKLSTISWEKNLHSHLKNEKLVGVFCGQQGAQLLHFEAKSN